MDNSDRNVAILALLDLRKYSYAVIAERLGTTRNVVAGVAFRDRHTQAGTELASSPNACRSKNKTGTGYKRRSYDPEITAKTPG